MTWDMSTIVTAGTSVLVTLITGSFGLFLGLANGRREDEHAEAEREDAKIATIISATETHRAWAEGNFVRMQKRIDELEGKVTAAEGKALRLEEANAALVRYLRILLGWVEKVLPDVHPPQPPEDVREYIRP